MGLDMYLNARTTVSDYPFVPDEQIELYRRLVEEFDLEEVACKDSPHVTLEFTVAYWRKANAIHGWFVENVQNGVDDCRPYYTPAEKLRELKALCHEVLAGKALSPARATALANDRLAPQSGFFFGGTEIDEWYWQDLQSTATQLESALTIADRFDLYYEASW